MYVDARVQAFAQIVLRASEVNSSQPRLRPILTVLRAQVRRRFFFANVCTNQPSLNELSGGGWFSLQDWNANCGINGFTYYYFITSRFLCTHSARLLSHVALV